MDHAEAVQTQAAEKYLLGEFSATQQDEFAEHFFDCEECANDMRLTSLFMDTSKKVLAAKVVERSRPVHKWWTGQWYATAASIALLGLVLYQNGVTIPKLRTSSAAQALEVFSIANVGSRSSSELVITPIHQKPFILLLDIPPHENIYQYRCEISSPNGTRVISINVAQDLARKTVPLLIPASALAPGSYTMTISGRPREEPAFTQLEQYPFRVM